MYNALSLLTKEAVIMANTEFVAALVQKTTQFTQTLMEQDAVSWEKAKIGVQRIMLELTTDYPEHSSFIQSEMQSWIDQQDRRHAAIGWTGLHR
jgi:hypothetical protein